MDHLVGERAQVMADLSSSVRRSGLTQARFARLLGTSGSRMSAYVSGATIPSAALYLRAIHLGDALQRMRALGLLTPDQTVDAVDRALSEQDEDFALRMILQARDDIRRAAHEPAVRAAWSHRSQQITDERFDSLFKAVVAHEFAEDGPAWTETRPLERDWVVVDPFRDEVTIRAQTPPWLARLGIFIAERGLVTV